MTSRKLKTRLCYIAAAFLFLVPSFALGKVLDDSFNFQDLKGKKLGYYIGSFDPIHLGHQQFIESLLSDGHVDYVLIYAIPGADAFKSRTDLKLREKMIFSIYEQHANVFVTTWTPYELNKHFRKCSESCSIIGIIGSDIVKDKFMSHDKELQEQYDRTYMRGLSIPKEHCNDTIGARMALKVDSFIVALRGEDDLTSANGKVGERKMKTITIDPPFKHISSSRIKIAIGLKASFEMMLAQPVQAIIKSESLYGYSPLDILTFENDTP